MIFQRQANKRIWKGKMWWQGREYEISPAGAPCLINPGHCKLWVVGSRINLNKNILCALGHSGKCPCPAASSPQRKKSRNKLYKRNLILMKQIIPVQLDFSSITEYWSHFGGRNVSDCGSLSCCANFRISLNDVPRSISKVGMSAETEQKYLLSPCAKCFEILVGKKWKMSKASSSLNSLAMVILHGHHSQEECFIWEGIITSCCQNMKSNYAVN